MLKEHGGLTHALGSFDANEAFAPVDFAVEIALVLGLGLFQTTVEGTK